MSDEARLGKWWKRVAERLDTPRMQEGTRAPGRVWPSHLAPEGLPPGATQTGQWGKTLIDAGTTAYSVVSTSDFLRPVRFSLYTEVNDYTAALPTIFDPATPLEVMQAEGKKLLDGWQPEPFAEMRVAVRVKRDTPPQAAPQWDPTTRVWWLSSLYSFVAAR